MEVNDSLSWSFCSLVENFIPTFLLSIDIFPKSNSNAFCHPYPAIFHSGQFKLTTGVIYAYMVRIKPYIDIIKCYKV